MKKYFLLGLIVAIMPSICFGARSSYTQLVREKQRKMAELEKCMGTTNGLKIAGLSTLGLSAVGVVGNLAEAQKIKEYDEYIEEKVPEAMERIETSIAEEREKLAKNEKGDDQTKIINITNDNIQKSLTEFVNSDEFKANVAAADVKDAAIANMEIELIEEESELPDELIQYYEQNCTKTNGDINDEGICICPNGSEPNILGECSNE